MKKGKKAKKQQMKTEDEKSAKKWQKQQKNADYKCGKKAIKTRKKNIIKKGEQRSDRKGPTKSQKTSKIIMKTGGKKDEHVLKDEKTWK